MSQEVNVGISDMKLVRVPEGLITYALGSCVGICVLDKTAQVAGMAHILLPYNNNEDNTNLLKYADTGINEMIKQMELLGANRLRMIVKIAGGAKMFDIKKSLTIGNIGERNIAAVKETLHKLKLKIYAEDIGENYGRTIIFDSKSGDLTVKSFGRSLKVI